MVDVRNVKGEKALLEAELGKSFGYFIKLLIFHCHNSVSPGNVLFGNRLFIVKPCRPCFKPLFEQLFSCPAPVLVLVADEQNFHDSAYKANYNLNVAGLEAKISLPAPAAASRGLIFASPRRCGEEKSTWCFAKAPGGAGIGDKFDIIAGLEGGT